MIECITNHLSNVIVTILTTFISYIGVQIKKTYQEKIQEETKRKIVTSGVKATEQVYQNLKGNEKLQKAKETILPILIQKGIKLVDQEIDVLIEEACHELKQNS